MPYRRLPNTDSSRLKSLHIAMSKGENLSPREKPYSQSSLHSITKVLPQFEHLTKLQKEAYKIQTDKSKQYNYLYKKARNYVSHFIQVLNLAIIRGDLKPEARDFFHLDKDEKKLPIFKTEQDLITWGKLVVEGEPLRIGTGGNPMTNPTVGVVRVHYEKFLEAYRFQKKLQESYAKTTKDVAEYRPEVDRVILQLWNEIEASFDPNSEIVKRNLCREYGVVYFFRRNEIISDKEHVSDEYRKNRVLNKDLREAAEKALEGDSESLEEDEHTKEALEILDRIDVEDQYSDEEINNELPEVEKNRNEHPEDDEDEASNFQYSLF